MERAGYRQVTLSSLSSGDFRGIHGLVRDLNARYAPRKVSFSLPSLRVDSLALGLLKEISEVRKSGLTFAVETATPEWQREVRKTVALDKVIGLLREAKAQGWKAAKFYFMVGLPPSFDQDEAAPIIEFLRAVRAATGMSLNVNVAPFIPKPHTPWQRAAQLGERAGDGQDHGGPEEPRRGRIQDRLPCADSLPPGRHRVAGRREGRDGSSWRPIVAGARLDAWEEHVKLDLWRQVIADADWDVLGETCRRREPERAAALGRHLPCPCRRA